MNNMAVRVATRKSLTAAGSLSVAWLGTRAWHSLALLLTACVLSAFSVIFVTHSLHNLAAEAERLQQEYWTLQTEKAQLLLERGMLIRQVRIQQFAENQFDMITPQGDSFRTLPE